MEDNVRDFVIRLRKKAVNMSAAAETTIRKAGKITGDSVEVAKLNMKIFDLNGEIGLHYRKLGEMIYAAHKGKEICDDDVETLMVDIDAKQEEIVRFRERISILKKAVSCPECGESSDKDDKFCKMCGAA